MSVFVTVAAWIGESRFTLKGKGYGVHGVQLWGTSID